MVYAYLNVGVLNEYNNSECYIKTIIIINIPIKYILYYYNLNNIFVLIIYLIYKNKITTYFIYFKLVLVLISFYNYFIIFKS